MGLQDVLLIVLMAMGVTALGTFLVTRAIERHHMTVRLSGEVLEDHQQLVQRLEALERQLVMIGNAVLPITTAFQATLVKELTHFHEPRTDELLEKLGPPLTLTEEEEVELLARLKQREQDMGGDITPSERDAAHILPLLMKRIRAEKEALQDMPPLFRLVTIVTPKRADELPAKPPA